MIVGSGVVQVGVHEDESRECDRLPLVIISLKLRDTLDFWTPRFQYFLFIIFSLLLSSIPLRTYRKKSQKSVEIIKLRDL